MYDHAKFFAGLRLLVPKLTQAQVDGFNLILDAGASLPPRQLAYCLATAWHETAKAMQPVIETRTTKDKDNPSVDTAIARLEASWKRGKLPWVKQPYWRKDAKGLSWLGRGYPQVTHLSNYARAEKETGIGFTANPDLMLIAANAVPVMFSGMSKGWFTGHKLGDYFLPNGHFSVKDKNCKESELLTAVDARHIINGTESATTVAGYYMVFVKALVPSA